MWAPPDLSTHGGVEQVELNLPELIRTVCHGSTSGVELLHFPPNAGATPKALLQ